MIDLFYRIFTTDNDWFLAIKYKEEYKWQWVPKMGQKWSGPSDETYERLCNHKKIIKILEYE